jgi:hypothetical protein
MELSSNIWFAGNDRSKVLKPDPAVLTLQGDEISCMVNGAEVFRLPVSKIEQYSTGTNGIQLKTSEQNYVLMFLPMKKLLVWQAFGLLGGIVLSKALKQTDCSKWVEALKSYGIQGGTKWL